ncbi:MAG TPA: adenosine deaminase family protein [Candidatus Obscuribacterales bacterium]
MHNLIQLPKAELHLHLEGAPRWSTLRAAHNHHFGTSLPKQPPWHEAGFRFSHFGEFQDLFRRYIHPWLQTPRGYAEVMRDVVDSLIEQNIRYAEVNFAPSMVARHGASLPQVWDWIAAELERARSHHCIIRIFVGLMRPHGVEEAIAWVKETRLLDIVSGYDLQGDEVGWPADLFQPAFDLARDVGKRVKVHAGEMTGPESIRMAVEQMGITQIGHGTSAVQDPDLVELLRDRQVTVEVCPTSNERLGNVASYLAHPIFELDQARVAVTVNSDDPTFFGVTLTDELLRLMQERKATLTDIKRWMSHAFQKALIDDKTRQQVLQELNRA